MERCTANLSPRFVSQTRNADAWMVGWSSEAGVLDVPKDTRSACCNSVSPLDSDAQRLRSRLLFWALLLSF